MKLAQRVCLLVCLAVAANADCHEIVLGWEGGSANGYGFVQPVFSFPDAGTGSAFIIRPSVGYLYYDMRDSTGVTHVTSPGASIGIAYRLRTPRLTLTLGPGYEARNDRRELPDGSTVTETQKGLTFTADAYIQASPLTAVSLIGTYGDANRYSWSRAGLKHQITDRDFSRNRAIALGVEVTEQGNYEIRQTQLGALVEFTWLAEHTSLQIHGGASRLRYTDQTTDTRPYVGIGLYHAY